jgi:signal transduction histidine kinase
VTERRPWRVESTIAWARVFAVPFAIVEVGVLSSSYPPGYELAAWLTTAALTAGAAVFFWLSRTEFEHNTAVGVTALAFDSAVITAYAVIYQYEIGTPVRQLFLVPVIEGAVRYGLWGGLTTPFAILPGETLVEWWRADRFPPPDFTLDHITLQFGLGMLIGLIVGSLVKRLRTEAAFAQERATEAEALRDELGHRVDILDAANRCARALSSSLELDQAFNAFIRELGGLVPFERVAILSNEGDSVRVVAAAGAGAENVFPAGTTRPVAVSIVDEVIETRQAVYRPDMRPSRYPEEEVLLELGLRCRLVAPLLSGARVIGMLALVRADPDSFTEDEIELVGLLGRLVGSAVQNIRAYEAERSTVEELRRLSALRADFVSLVSHELRSPMAAVIGSARTLQQRWRELTADQRESFLALIGDETSRLSELIADVLDTSRIEAGTFSYSFGEVDLAELIRESVATADLGQDEVKVRASVPEPLPRVRGDRERLRQVLLNLLENAVKYTASGDEVEVAGYARDAVVRIEVHDHGPGISPEHHKLIFEKFGRVTTGGAVKKGTGLGLFIARSIAEAHGGGLNVSSVLERGSTFTLELPVESDF